MDVTIVDRPEQRVAGIRHIGPYMEIGREFGRLGGLLKGPPPAGSHMIAIYHDDPDTTPPDRLRSDAALTLSGHTPAPMGLIEQRVPAGRYARTVHHGGYEGLPGAWAALKAWATQHGHTLGHPGCEVYLNDPTATPQAELLTEVFMRLA